MKGKWGFFLGVLALLLSKSANAGLVQIEIPDASQIAWAISGTSVYFRNLNSFNPGAPACCYSVWLDLTTDQGRAMFSAFLSKNVSKQSIKIYLDDNVGGKVMMIGFW